MPVTFSKFVFFKDDKDAVNFINYYAPEHYMICVEKNQFYIDGLKNAGSVFIGNFSPETLGDYASGTNHTLPTKKAGKYTGGLWVGKFIKTHTYQKITTDEAAAKIGEYGSRLSHLEGFIGHAEQCNVRVRRYGGINVEYGKPASKLKN